MRLNADLPRRGYRRSSGVSRTRRLRTGIAAFPAIAVLAATLGTTLFAPPAGASWWKPSYDWPSSSDVAVTPLVRPSVESVFEARARTGRADTPFRFVAFGDQRALADGEWQQMLHRVASVSAAGNGIDFLLDTGDIVNDGRHTDQFARLANEILAIVPDRPYLVGVGNHEVHDNDAQARANTATFLSPLDPVLSPDRLYYRKDLGPATFLFLDTNDLVYGDDGERGECPPEIAPGTRAAAQIEWLAFELEDLRAHPRPLVFAVLHHPFVQSSQKHRDAAASLWNLRVRGTSFPDFLADGGVHVVLTGHTHTYERFVLTRDDGRAMHVVNLSGRPRGSAFGFGAGRRRARDIRGEEAEKLGEWGWRDLARWSITQEAAMRKEDEANQFATFTVDPDGGLTMEVHFVDEEAAIEAEANGGDDASGPRRVEPVRLR